MAIVPIIVSRNGKQKTFLTRMPLLLQKDFWNWSQNRPADINRIDELDDYYRSNNIDLVPGVIYVWKKSTDKKYYIYDGIHRFEAAKNFPNMSVILTIYYTDDENDILEDFNNVNKNIAVPELYFDNDDRRKLIAQQVVEHICLKYPTHNSASDRFQRPNFNRDMLTTVFYDLDWKYMTDLTIKASEVATCILMAFEKINADCKIDVDKCKGNGANSHIKKCYDTQCFIFFRHNIKKDPESFRQEFLRRLESE
jgi:hypothetical protein